PYGAVELVGQAGLLESLADGGEQGAQEVVAGQKPGDAVAQDQPDPPADGAGQERLVGDQGAQPPGRQPQRGDDAELPGSLQDADEDGAGDGQGGEEAEEEPEGQREGLACLDVALDGAHQIPGPPSLQTRR